MQLLMSFGWLTQTSECEVQQLATSFFSRWREDLGGAECWWWKGVVWGERFVSWGNPAPLAQQRVGWMGVRGAWKVSGLLFLGSVLQATASVCYCWLSKLELGAKLENRPVQCMMTRAHVLILYSFSSHNAFCSSSDDGDIRDRKLLKGKPWFTHQSHKESWGSWDSCGIPPGFPQDGSQFHH